MGLSIGYAVGENVECSGETVGYAIGKCAGIEKSSSVEKLKCGVENS